MRIRELFNEKSKLNEKLFIPYITCGDRTLKDTEELVHELMHIGVDAIELGVPFSDPVADGRVNQKSSARALKNNVSLTDCCKLVKKLRANGVGLPIILFTYFNPIVKLGIKEFAMLANDCGVDAVLVVDLPLEESHDLFHILRQQNIGSILLISPTTSSERIELSSQLATEFLYYVSRAGVTGVQDALSETLASELELVKQHTLLPIAVGFGISTPLQASLAAKLADGVIVGSALVEKLASEDIEHGKKELLKLAALFRLAIL